MGSKTAAPAKEAMVEMVFDNSQKTFYNRQRWNINQKDCEKKTAKAFTK